jgi:WD40 repeat protein
MRATMSSNSRQARRGIVAAAFRVPLLAAIAVFVAVLCLLRWSQRPPEYFPALEIKYHPTQPMADVTSLAFTPEGDILAAGLFDTRLFEANGKPGVVATWDTSSGRNLTERSTGELFPTALSCTPDGDHLVVAEARYKKGTFFGFANERVYDNRGRIQILDPTTLVDQKTIELDWSAYGIAISPDGKTVAAIGSGNSNEVRVGLWDLASAAHLKLWQFAEPPAVVDFYHPVRPMMFSSDGTELYVVTGRKIQIVDVARQKILKSWELETTDAPAWVDISRDGNYLAVTMGWLWKINGNSGSPEKIRFLGSGIHRFRATGNELFYASVAIIHAETAPPKYCVQLIDVNGGEVTAGFRDNITTTTHISALAKSENDAWLAAGGQLGQIHVWKLPQPSPASR